MRFYIVDVFARRKYQGNQLGVFLCPEDLPGDEMQSIAREMGFSECTFVGGLDLERREADVRIFTPRTELDFAGHPVLGTAHVLERHLLAKPVERVTLNLKVGPVVVQCDPGATPPFWVEQPEPVLGETLPVDTLAGILNLQREAFVEGLPPQIVSTGLPHVIVPVADRRSLGRISVDLAGYYRLVEETGVKNILVYADDPHEPDQDRAVRMFADALGVPEDPATGSGNGCLAAYLIHHDRTGAEALEYVVGQGYEIGRPSQLWLQVRRTDGAIRVRLGGYSVDVAQGTWDR